MNDILLITLYSVAYIIIGMITYRVLETKLGYDGYDDDLFKALLSVFWPLGYPLFLIIYIFGYVYKIIEKLIK